MSSRRKFLQQSSLILGAGTVASAFDNKAFAFFKNRVAPSDQLNIGAIGINGMGWANAKTAIKIPGVNLVAVCDADRNVIDKKLAELTPLNIDITKIKIYDDYRKLLAKKISMPSSSVRRIIGMR